MGAFEADFKNAPFLPDEFKSKKKIEEMAGVYVPFWMFDCDCDAAVSYNAQRVTAWSDSNFNYTKTNGKLKKMKTAVENNYAANYVKPGSMNISISRDLFLYSQITKTEKQQSDSGTHTSSSGRTHGGSGGSF